MAYLQERVAHYLACDPHVFVAEERQLQYGPDPEKDLWYIDALAADLWQRTLFIGEATYDLRPARLIRKLLHFYQNKSEVVKWLSLKVLPPEWEVRPWIFIRKDAMKYVTGRMPDGCDPRITYLENTAFPWEYETCRRAGKEPERPYEGLNERFQK